MNMYKKREERNNYLIDLNHHHPPNELTFTQLVKVNETIHKKERRPLPPVPNTRRRQSERESTGSVNQLPSVPPRSYLQKYAQTNIQSINTKQPSTSQQHQHSHHNNQYNQKYQKNEKEIVYYTQLMKKLDSFIPFVEQLQTPIKDQSLHSIVHRQVSIKGMITYLQSHDITNETLQQLFINEEEGDSQSYCDMIEESINYIDRLFLGVLDTFGLSNHHLETVRTCCDSIIPSESEITFFHSCPNWKHLEQLRNEGIKQVNQAITKWKAIERIQSEFIDISFHQLKQTGVIGWGRVLEHVFLVDVWDDNKWKEMMFLFTNDLIIIKSTEIHFLAFIIDIQYSTQSYGDQSMIHLTCPSRDCSLYLKSINHLNTIISLLSQSNHTSGDIPQIYQFPLEL